MADKKKKKSKKNAARRTKKRAAARVKKRTKKKPAPTVAAAVLDSDKLKDLYAAMLKCRTLAEQASALVKHSASGPRNHREAVLVGAIAHALPQDSVAVAEDSSLVRFIKKTPLAAIVGKSLAAQSPATGSSTKETVNGRESPGSSPAKRCVAASMTLANEQKEKGTPTIVVALPGRDADALAFQYDALALAAKYKLPLVCVVETSAEFEWTAEKQRAQNGPGAAESHFPEITVDGNDVVAVFRVVQEATRRARAGHGPSLIQCVMPESTHSHNFNQMIRDPLEHMQEYLRRKNLWSEAWRQQIKNDFGSELKAALAAAETAGESLHLTDRVYSPERPGLRSSRMAEPTDENAPSSA